MRRVIILTGPVGSGKTTALAKWRGGRGVVGVLQPRTGAGRMLEDLATGERVPLEAGGEERAVVAVGRYRFRAAAFDWANARLAAARGRVVVVDEVGPLELRGEGLAPGVRAALGGFEGRVVLVVRDGLVEEMCRTFGLGRARMIQLSTLIGAP